MFFLCEYCHAGKIRFPQTTSANLDPCQALHHKVLLCGKIQAYIWGDLLLCAKKKKKKKNLCQNAPRELNKGQKCCLMMAQLR